MTTERWRRVQAAFLEIADLPQEQKLEALSHLNSEIREEVAAMVAADDPDIDAPIDEKWEGSVHEALSGLSETEAPQQVGPYRIVKELGRGGMGIVYLAERADGQFEQRVALKLVKRGLDTDAILARFLNERQVLAALQHPNIARLYDGGIAENGQPWFAMEYVDGVPITDYCNKNDLSIRERLELFLKVCHAVRHAHNQLIIHRDLKPSNILVTKDGEPHLLDFGLAKVLQDPAGDPATTRPEQRWMTLDYASPEQIKGEAVGTPSDTYQLGLVLYEILTGQRAYTVKGLSPTEAERVICEVDPPRPSTAVAKKSDVASHDPAPSNFAVASRTTLPIRPAKLQKRLRGDLDTIILKALNKDPDRGFASADTLAADIQRHLDGLPIHARPDTTRYRVMKFVGRHRWGVAVAGFVALLVLGGSAALLIQNRRITRESERAQLEATKAERISEFMTGIYEAADPFGPERGEINTQDLLELSVERIRNELAGEPDVRAELLGAVGRVYLQQSRPNRAEPLLAEALQIQDSLYQVDHPNLAHTLTLWAGYLSRIGDYTGAGQTAKRALAMHQSLFGDHHEAVAKNYGQLAVNLMYEGRYVEAEPVARKTLSLTREIGSDEDIALRINLLGLVLTGLGEYREAESLYREGIEIRESIYEPDQAGMATIPHNLAVNLAYQGRLDEAETLVRDALMLRRDAHREGHPRIAYTLDRLGHIVRLLGRPDEAEGYHREAMQIRRTFQLQDHRQRARGLYFMAGLAQERGNLEEAERLYLKAISDFETHGLSGYRYTGSARIALGWLWLRQGRVVDAEPLLEEALETHLQGSGEQSDDAAKARVALGLLRATQGRTTDARTLLSRGLVRLQRYALADAEMLTEAQRVLAELEEEN